MADIGIRKGLAQSFGYDQATADLARQQDQMRQAKIYAENKAKMLAEDFDYNSAINAWDNTAIKEYAQGKIKELGAFVRENPDYLYNVEKRIAYNNIKRELKDSKPLMEGLQVDSNVKAMEQWKNDPKNAPLLDTPEFQKTLQDYQNYIKTGSADGNTANRKLFTFYPPEELVDTTPLLSKYAQMAAQNGKDIKYLAKGAGSIHQFVSDSDKALAAEGALNDRELGRYLRKEYNDYAEKNNGQPPMNIKQYAVAKMQPYFKGDDYKNFSYATGDGRGSGSGAGAVTGERNYYKELTDRAKKASNQNTITKADPDGLNQVLTGGRNVLNTNGMLFEASPGNYVPFKGSITKNYTTSQTKAKFDQDGLKASVLVQMPLTDFESSLDNADVFDYPTFGTGWLGNETTVKQGWEDRVRIVENENGEKIAEFELWAPLEEKNTNTSAGYNHGMHAKAEGTSSDFGLNAAQYKVSPDGTMYQDMSTGKIYDAKTNQEIK